MSETPERRRFPCTADGVVASGQQRMARVFALLAFSLLAAAAFAIVTRQIFAAAVALVLSLGVFIIYRMSRELDPTELIVQGGTLTVLMRHALRKLPLEDSSIRRLTGDEIEHLSGLTSSGGFVAGAGGFDSHILGEFDLYASRLENSILLETMDGRVIVTPDTPDEFIESVVSAAEAAAMIPSP